MKINARLRATAEEILELFDFDDVVTVEYFNQFRNGIYSVLLNIPDCDMKDSQIVKTIEEIKEEVVEKCKDLFTHIAQVEFVNEEIKTMYGRSEDELNKYIEMYCDRYGMQVGSINLINK